MAEAQGLAVAERGVGVLRGLEVAAVGVEHRPGPVGQVAAAGDVVGLQVGLEGAGDGAAPLRGKANVEIEVARGVEDHHLLAAHQAVAARGLARADELEEFVVRTGGHLSGHQQVAPGLDAAGQVAHVRVAVPLEDLGHVPGRPLLGADDADRPVLRHPRHGFLLQFHEVIVADVVHLERVGRLDVEAAEVLVVADVNHHDVVTVDQPLEQVVRLIGEKGHAILLAVGKGFGAGRAAGGCLCARAEQILLTPGPDVHPIASPCGDLSAGRAARMVPQGADGGDRRSLSVRGQSGGP